MTGDVRRAETDAEREDALEVRHGVFVEEQGVSPELEADGKDDEAIHFVGYAECESSGDDSDATDRRPVAAGRLRTTGDGVGKVERIAVLAERRGEGWGREIMAELEATAEERGISKLVMHAQTPVEGFYHALDYETTSEVFEEVGIPHVEMEKRLD